MSTCPRKDEQRAARDVAFEIPARDELGPWLEAMLDAIAERDVVTGYPDALAAYADLHTSLGNLPEARAYLDRAHGQQSSAPERALLARKRATLGGAAARSPREFESKSRSAGATPVG